MLCRCGGLPRLECGHPQRFVRGDIYLVGAVTYNAKPSLFGTLDDAREEVEDRRRPKLNEAEVQWCRAHLNCWQIGLPVQRLLCSGRNGKASWIHMVGIRLVQ